MFYLYKVSEGKEAAAPDSEGHSANLPTGLPPGQTNLQDFFLDMLKGPVRRICTAKES